MDIAGIGALEDKLKSLKLEHEPAENVAEFKKISFFALKLSNCVDANGEPHTRDLSTLVAKCFTKCTVDAFCLEALTIYNKCNDDPQSMK